MSGDTWFKIRLVLMATCFFSAMFTPQPLEEHQMPSGIAPVFFAVFCVLALLTIPLVPLGLARFVAVQAGNSPSDEYWTLPTHRSNPFQLRNPLPFFHFSAFWFGSVGLGLLISSLWRGPALAFGGLFGILAGVMTLVGVRGGMRVIKHKMAGRSSESPAQAAARSEAYARRSRCQRRWIGTFFLAVGLGTLGVGLYSLRPR